MDIAIDAVAVQGITEIKQWFIIIGYRFLLYIVPALILTCLKFDKRYKWISRFVIWLNWILLVYLLWNLVTTFALDKLLRLPTFNTVDAIIGLSGYVLTGR